MNGQGSKKTSTRLLCQLSLCALSLGCANDGIGTLYPVSGQILLDGKPLIGVAQGSVSLRGDAAKGNKTMHQPTGAIDGAGRFELFTVQRKGAPPGWYKVVVAAYANRIEEGPVTPRLLIDKRYYDPEKTDLHIEVVASPTAGAYDLKVTKGASRSR